MLTESCSAARRLHRKNDASGDATEFSPCVPERNRIASPVTFVMAIRRGVVCGRIFSNAFQVESPAARAGLLSAPVLCPSHHHQKEVVVFSLSLLPLFSRTSRLLTAQTTVIL